MKASKWALPVIGAAIVIGLTACGGGSDNTNDNNTAGGGTMSEPSNNITIKATDWKFDMAEYKVKKGETVKFTLKNEKGNHGVGVVNSDLKLENNKTVEYKFDNAGTYEMICNIPCGQGHAQMKAKIVVVE